MKWKLTFINTYLLKETALN